MNTKLTLALLLAGSILAPQALAQITFYDREGYQGRSFTTAKSMDNLERRGFNDRAASAVVANDRWEVCVDAGYRGRCVVLRPGNYPSLGAMSLDDRISSVRIVSKNARYDDQRYAPAPIAANDYRRRDRELIYEAEITSVHAVMGAPEQHCWVERHEVQQADSGANVPGAVAGAIIGGILGHQVGGGRGKDLATVGGAVGGGMLGANVGRDRTESREQDVQRCSQRPSEAHPAYWDVTYEFRGREHHVQLTSPPQRTVTVNELGEPRA
jgi:uncharacterized protein YcfJ